MVLPEFTTWTLAGIGGGLLIGSLVSSVVVGASLRKKNARRIVKLHDEFTDLASHYLLNPITIIQTAVYQLQEKDSQFSSEERNKLYDAIIRGQQRLWITTEQLVLVSDLRDNRLELSLTVGQPGDIVMSAMTAVNTFAKYKRISFKFSGPSTDAPTQARLDTRRLKQAVIAILDNAIKFTPEDGQITVSVNLDKSSNIWNIVIEDEGIGMSAEVQSHLAEQFYRGTSLYNFDYEGMGLGLYIAQSIVRLHQGNISVDSKPKNGTIVTIQFPNL